MKPTDRFSTSFCGTSRGRNRFVVEDADGSVSLRFADAENHDIDMQAALAREVRACAVDMPVEAVA
jgi:hypothetical protein